MKSAQPSTEVSTAAAFDRAQPGRPREGRTARPSVRTDRAEGIAQPEEALVMLRAGAAGDASLRAAFDRAGMNPLTVGLCHLRSIHMSFPVLGICGLSHLPVCEARKPAPLGHLPKGREKRPRHGYNVLGFKWARSPLIRSLGGCEDQLVLGDLVPTNQSAFDLLARSPEPDLRPCRSAPSPVDSV